MKNKKLISTLSAVAIAASMTPVSVFADTISTVGNTTSGIENTVSGEESTGDATTTTPSGTEEGSYESTATEVTVDSAEDFNNAISNSNITTINLSANITLNATANITRGLTINGNGHNITYTGALGTNLFNVTTNDNFTIKSLNGETTNGRLMGLSSTSPHVYINDGVFYVKERGISFVQDGIAENAELVLDNVKMRCTGQINKEDDYNKNTSIGQLYRGISIYDVKNSEITLKNNSELSGFGYCINASGDADSSGIVDASGVVVNVKESTIRGWGCFNIWHSFAEYNIEDSYILGINNSNGRSDSFSAIVFNDDIYDQFQGEQAYSNKLYIKDTTITNYQNNPSELITEEYLLRVDIGDEENKQKSIDITFGGEVKFIDTTGKLTSATCLDAKKKTIYDEDSEAVVNQKKEINKRVDENIKYFLKNNITYEDGAKVIVEGSEDKNMKFANEINVETISKDGGNKFFVDLIDAIAAAKEGDTVKLLENIIVGNEE